MTRTSTSAGRAGPSPAIATISQTAAREAAAVIAVSASLDADAAGLQYVSDQDPGIRRIRSGEGFRYQDSQGRPVKDEKTLKRIASLVIPPAWNAVWICPTAQGHLQATGRDARNRKQYRYHPRWREVRDKEKFERMVFFGLALARIRRRVRRDLKLPGMPRPKVLATIVRLLELTLIRVGNEEYAKQNGSFGLTTLRDEHADIHGSSVRFHFRGKAGKRHSITVIDRRLAQLVKRCQDLPGHELFQYEDENGEPRSIGSTDVNEYLREITGADFTAKDFRTWAGTLLAAQTLVARTAATSARSRRKAVVDAIRVVSERLGDTLAVCRKCYIHPAILDAFLEGSLSVALEAAKQNQTVRWLHAEELALIAFLRSQGQQAGKRRSGTAMKKLASSLAANRRSRLTAKSTRTC